ncbi:MAG: choice-of-anchor L domain-containing protein [Crocinitomicaceae bacterium]|nr:choice-of-anchor L domain-containing protein [Crocinitomicaceae bacterium]
MKLILSLFSIFLAASLSAQLTVTSTMTPLQYVQDVLVGTGVQVSNVTFNGNANYSGNQIGKFEYVGTQIDYTSGLVMGSGGVVGLKGPNNDGSHSTLASGTMVSGDLQLQATANVTATQLNDIGRLEFDFIPAGNTVSFNFRFGSEEYDEFVCSGFKDVFGFFVTALTPLGGTYNNTNLALVPGTNLPITINTINNGTSGSSGSASTCNSENGSNAQWIANSAYFAGAPGAHFQADGMTNSINITFAVVCGEAYRFKFAIADVGDSSYDSWVMFESGSFNSDAIQVSVATVTGDSSVIEGCTTADFIFVRPTSDIQNPLTINYTISGTSTQGVDYPALPNPIYFAPGEDSVVITLAPVQDNISEGPESVIITVIIVNECGDSLVSEGTVWILDKPNISINLTDINVVCSTDSVPMSASAQGGFPPYTFLWSNGQTGANAFGEVSINGPTQYFVTATDLCGFTQVDTLTINLNQALFIDSMIQYPATACDPTGAVAGYASGFSGVPLYQWSGPGANSPNSTTASVFQNLSSGWYYFTIKDNVCTVTDSIFLKQELAPVAEFTASSVVGCSPMTVTFTNVSQNTNTYNWDFGNGQTLTTTDKTTHTVVFTQSATVSLNASQSGCADDFQLNITVSKCGCTDPNALNYDPTAQLNDGSCIYPDPIIVVPNVFTPDDDLVNGLYFLKTEHVTELEMTIFNRWGNVMFRSSELTGSWDGKVNGELAADGVYFLKYTAKGFNGSVEGHTFLHLIRK